MAEWEEAPEESVATRPLFLAWPELVTKLPWVKLGKFPTPVQGLPATCERIDLPADRLFVKRDDLSSRVYGGNKVRTLEVLFGEAIEAGSTRIYSTGAFGSNHAAATVLHAKRIGLEGGAILFPQPRSYSALENLRVILSTRPIVRAPFHWSALPYAMFMVRRQDSADGVRSTIMVPGGATPRGALGYVSAALELAHQVKSGEMPRPRSLVIGVGSTCTSAGLLVGLRIAGELGIGWTTKDIPQLVSVRVTPWPVTSAFRIVGLAVDTAKLLSDLTGKIKWAYNRSTLRPGLTVDGRYLGPGYGRPTDAGIEAIKLFRETADIELDTTYSAKAVASAIDRARTEDGPILYWSTKSTYPLPDVTKEDWDWAPRSMTNWIEKAERECERI